MYVGVAEDAGSKHRVLCALTHNFHFAPDVDLEAIAQVWHPHQIGVDHVPSVLSCHAMIA